MRWAWSSFTALALGALALAPNGAHADPLCAPFATGGVVSLIQIGNQQFCVHQFIATGSSSFTAAQALSLQYLIVGGGGGGGSSDLWQGVNYYSGGGGGAGGVRQGSAMALAAGGYTVVVGAGGAGGTSSGTARGLNGGNSSFNSVVASGGGGGGGSTSAPAPVQPTSGGSGGGGGGRQGWSRASATNGAAGIAGQGNGGGNGNNGNNIQNQTGGGGGGAGGPGGNGLTNLGGVGGVGITSDITGLALGYAGGGGGGHRGPAGIGGNASQGGGGGGGGASATNPGNGALNTGGGGGGAGRFQDQGGNGGSGVVILRYLVNTAPDANAGPDQTVFSLSLATLDGTGSTDPDNNITSYSWVQLSGTPVSLNNANTPQPSFTPPQPAGGAASDTLVFELTVTDAFGLTSTDTITITLQGVADIEVEKQVSVFSEESNEDCGILTATAPTEPANPAAIPGACVEYIVSVENTGPVTAQDITLVDALPGHLTLQAAGLDTNWGAGTTLATPGCPSSGCEVRVENGEIAPNATATLTIRATLN